MICTVIIDTKQQCVDRLLKLIQERYNNLIEVAATYTSAEEGLEGIKSVDPDLVFLEILLGNESGFDLLEQLEHYSFKIIFTTASEQFALKAFKYSAIDYLLKPIGVDDFERAMHKLINQYSVIHLASRMEVLMHNLEDKIDNLKKLVIPTLEGYTFIEIYDIIRCQADINYSILYLVNGQSLVVSKPLKDFEKLLHGHQFCRIHNSHLINLKHIKSYNKGKGGFVIMKDDSEIEVSTRRKKNFIKLFMNL